MQRLFFHNKYDKASRDIFDTLDEDVLAYDVYGVDRYKLPTNIKLSYLPYMVDKYFDFTPGTYTVNVPFTLSITCKDYLDNTITDESRSFRLTFDGNKYDITATNGVVEIEVLSEVAKTIPLKIEGDTYLPLETEVVVGA